MIKKKKHPAYGRILAEQIEQGFEPKTISIFLSWALFRSVRMPESCGFLVIGDQESPCDFDLKICRGFPVIVKALPSELESGAVHTIATQAVQAGARGVALDLYETLSGDFVITRHKGLHGIFECEAHA
jgi:hypothetical protein